jgi:hypothetical protein
LPLKYIIKFSPGSKFIFFDEYWPLFSWFLLHRTVRFLYEDGNTFVQWKTPFVHNAYLSNLNVVSFFLFLMFVIFNKSFQV